MARLKSDCVKWTLVLVLTIFSPYVYSRPQLESTLDVVQNVTTEKTEDPMRNSTEIVLEPTKQKEKPDIKTLPSTPNTSRDVKNKIPVIGDSIKKVATQLLDKPNKTIEVPVVSDTRIPPKVKTQFVQKLKIKTRNEDADAISESSHTGIAVPVTMEELELENKELPNETSTTNEGISTWILLSNPVNKDNNSVSTEPTQAEEIQKKPKPTLSKNKSKRPQNKSPIAKRPIIGSTNKADLVAGGSAISENVYNKLKDTVLSNVQKNKNTSPRTTTTSSTTPTPSTEALTTKATVSVMPVVKVTPKPAKKSHKNKQKTSTTTTTTTLAPIVSESAVLPMEAKEQEIELEINTPATTTKKPKRTSSKKKTKTKKRKTSKPKPETSTAVSSDVKTTNKTKTNKNSKKPASSVGPITSQIYNYFSREVIPSVGGVIGLAGLVGIASYFLFPFGSPVRRTIEVDKKDDIYRHNAEEYASEGNGQPEEEMLGTVLAGMPIHSKQKLNPYAGQMAYINRYPVKKDQDLRYRHVAHSYETKNKQNNNYYPQQKTGIAHGAVYPESFNYNRYQYETRHNTNAYTTEKKYDKAQTYSPYPAVEPIYAAPEVETTGVSSFGNDASSAVVYGVKPSGDSDFKPVYPYETQFYGETTSNPNIMTYPPTSMYLGSNNEAEETNNSKYSDEKSADDDDESTDGKFVVGNVPKELTETATPIVVPEHGPRNLNRKRRNSRSKRSIVGSIEDIIKAARENKENEIFISNEIDDGLEAPVRRPSLMEIMQLKNEETTPENKEVFTVYAVSVDPAKEFPQTEEPSTLKNQVIESVSTLPVDDKKDKTAETEMSNELDVTTETFKVYEVFPTSKSQVPDKSSPLISDNNNSKTDSTTQFKNMNTETTTEIRSETTSTMPPSPPPVSVTSKRPRPSYDPEVITYPPLSNPGGNGFFDFLKRIVEFKYRLGLSILQSTSESLNRYLRSLDGRSV
ncbi:uncharacterized protein LOC126769651 [Nymphalis io]|uniref:uncharacterized protein LOC126769651 n=1 Tax=Inachis io TaxID=171585 RepID=UPI002168EAAF|nr:uncharacterized protein LOC126769651 [Nymphalis io]